jgi:hypothetical protein
MSTSTWYLRRKQFIHFVSYNIFKIPPWVKPNKFILFLICLLFPIKGILYYNPWLKYDLYTDILTINGYKITWDVIESLVCRVPVGTVFKITERNEKTKTFKMEKIEGG